MLLNIIPIIVTVLISILIVLKIRWYLQSSLKRGVLREAQVIERLEQERTIKRQLILIVIGFILGYVPVSCRLNL